MKSSFHLLLVWLVLCYGILPTSAQQYLFDTEMITTENGLANLMVSAINKDERGMIWMATKHGLNSYDGHQFKLYTKEKNGFSDDVNVRQISEDDQGKLWLFHSKGGPCESKPAYIIDIFDTKTARAVAFKEYFKDKAPFAVEQVIPMQARDPQKALWFCTTQGEVYQYKQGAFKKVFVKAGATFHSLVVDEEATIWLVGPQEIIQLNSQGEVLTTFDLPGWGAKFWIEETKLWITVDSLDRENRTLRTKIFSIDPQNGNFTPFFLQARPNATKAVEVPIMIERDPNGQFWFANIEGELNIYNAAGQWLYAYQDPFYQRFLYGYNDWYVDGNLLWIATSMGVIKTRINKTPFRLIHQSSVYSDCRGITEDEQGNIYFLEREIYCWNPQTATIRQVTEEMGALSLTYYDSILWSGGYSPTYIGWEYDLRTQEKYLYEGEHKENTAMTTLSTSLPHQRLVGHQSGISILDFEQRKLLPLEGKNWENRLGRLLQKTQVLHLYENAEGIWATSEKGIFLLTRVGGVLRHYCRANGALPFDRIIHLHEDEDGVFWLASRGGGLIRWEPALTVQDTSRYQQFTVAEGLSNDYTHAVYEDEQDNLWIPSDFGLMQMNRKTLQIKSYFKADGLPHDEFNSTSHYQTKEGRLYLGGLGGLICFDPQAFTTSKINNTPFEFTGYYLLENNQEEITNRTQQLYTQPVIEMQPTDKFLELHFTLLDYEPPKKHRYAYKIEGYTDYWVHTKENYVRITNLPYGQYTLKVKGKRYNSEWAAKELSIKIEVLKPFYYQIWFIALVLSSILCMGFMIFKWRINQLEQTRENLELEVQKRTRQIKEDKQIIAAQAEALLKLDETKTRFFSNITHEFRTPLTLIIGPIEQLLQQKIPTKIHQQLSGVLKNGHHLLKLINQLLDFSKLESKQMAVESTYGDLVAYTRELTMLFIALAEQKEVQLQFQAKQASWQTFFDPDKWHKIVYNLLSNAIKFTNKGGTVELVLMPWSQDEQEWIKLLVKDTGIGIDPAAQQQIFDRFYQVDSSSTRTQEGTGIGLALVKELVELQKGTISLQSMPHQGTIFEVNLPVVSPANPVMESQALKPRATAHSLLPKKSAVVARESSVVYAERLSILLIEDNLEMQAYIRSCIDPTRYDITTAQNGEEGIYKALELIPDLIICDVMMPKKNGFEVVAALRNQLSTSHIPLILLTAKTSLESRLAGIERGADAYLTKPFNATELALRIQQLIEMRSLLQRRYNQQAPYEAPAPEQNFSKEDQFVADLKYFVEQNIQSSSLNGDSIAQHFNISRMQLHRKLKSLTNLTISEFIRDARLHIAWQLLQKGEANISEISYQTGFSSPGHFSRTFKKKYGKPPSEA